MRRTIASKFMRGILFNPAAGTQHVIDTTEHDDCTTEAGRARLRVFRPVIKWRRNDA
jgi:hypothetical protein